MKQLSFTKNLVLLAIGMVALVMIVAEGDNFRTTVFIKMAACALIAAGILLHNEWKEDIEKEA